MPAIKTALLTGLLLLLAQQSLYAQVVIEDGGVSLSQPELEYIVTEFSDQMRQAAANDEGDRLELVNKVLIIKKMAQEADKIPQDKEAYWRLSTAIMNAKRKMVLEEYVKSLKVPDMSDLAAERYQTEKEKYALVPEKRISSHILFACTPGQCSRAEVKAEAQQVLEQLRAGADFTQMVQAHSDDPGTKAKNGKFDKWMQVGEIGVAGPYSEGVFQIKNVGEYSDLVSSQFGFHIIRLDGIEEKHFLPYEEVKPKIVADLQTEFQRLSITEYNRTFNMTKDAVINREAMEKIFAPYKTKSE